MSVLGRLYAAGFLAACAALPSPAQTAIPEAAGPTLGFVIEESGHLLRPILGVAGAAVVGAPADLGRGISAEAVSPRGNYVIASAETASGSAAFALWMPGAALRALDGIPAGADRIALSPEGTAAAFYYAGEGLVRTVSGLPDAPPAVTEIYVNSLPGGPRALAVSDDGALILCAGRGSRTAVVFSAKGELNTIGLSAAIEAVAFAGGNHDAVVAGGGEAALIRNIEIPGERIALSAPGLKGITAAAISAGGRQVYLASRSGKIAVLDASGTQAPVILDCACAPDRIVRLNDTSSYRLTGYAGAPLTILDTAAQTPRIVIAPPPLDPGTQQ
jgi:DNA-binding beta-propeller fold protein YncE